MSRTPQFSVSGEEFIDNLIEENKRLQSALDYANRDRESMHYKIVELGNKRESQRNMNYTLRKQNKNLKEWNNELIENHKKDIDVLCEENKELQEKVNTYSEEYGKLREENRKQKTESEELKAWLRQKLPLALLKEYMEKFEGVDLKNV